MNYQVHYDRLIERARGRQLGGYKERHHVLPRCLGGSNAESNLVDLTAEEHFVAHQLLVKIHPHSSRVIHAANLMANRGQNNKCYGWLRRKHSLALRGTRATAEARAKMSESQKKRQRQPHSEQAKARMSAAKLGKRISPETRHRMSLARVGNTNRLGIEHSAEARLKMSIAALGRKLSPEWRDNIARGLSGRTVPLETRQKISASLTGKPCVRSPEGAARIAEAARRRMLSSANPMKKRSGHHG